MFNIYLHVTITFLDRTCVDIKNNKKNNHTPYAATFNVFGVILTRPLQNGHILPEPFFYSKSQLENSDIQIVSLFLFFLSRNNVDLI
jgi:hypothetical protein